MHATSPDAPAAVHDAGARERDADIVALLAQGDAAAAFATLLARYEAKIYRLCWTLLRDDAAAQDAAQDALLRIWRALASYTTQRAALSTWVYAITRNRCLSLLERRRDADVSSSTADVQAELERLPAPAASLVEESLAMLRQLVQALPESQRHCVQLYYYEERSVAEVGAMLGLPGGTVKTHLHRARAELLRQLAGLGLADASLWL